MVEYFLSVNGTGQKSGFFFINCLIIYETFSNNLAQIKFGRLAFWSRKKFFKFTKLNIFYVKYGA